MNADKIYEFDAPLIAVNDMDAAYIAFPYDLRKECGRGRMKVRAEFDGVPYDGSIVNMGVRNEKNEIVYIIGVPKAIRRRMGSKPGDIIHVRIRERE